MDIVNTLERWGEKYILNRVKEKYTLRELEDMFLKKELPVRDYTREAKIVDRIERTKEEINEVEKVYGEPIKNLEEILDKNIYKEPAIVEWNRNRNKIKEIHFNGWEYYNRESPINLIEDVEKSVGMLIDMIYEIYKRHIIYEIYDIDPRVIEGINEIVRKNFKRIVNEPKAVEMFTTVIAATLGCDTLSGRIVSCYNIYPKGKERYEMMLKALSIVAELQPIAYYKLEEIAKSLYRDGVRKILYGIVKDWIIGEIDIEDTIYGTIATLIANKDFDGLRRFVKILNKYSSSDIEFLLATLIHNYHIDEVWKYIDDEYKMERYHKNLRRVLERF